MKYFVNLILSIIIAIFFVACGSDYGETTSGSNAGNGVIQGVIQKGLFIDGTITAQYLDAEGNILNDKVSSTISSKGRYKLELKKNGLIALHAKGRFFNEYTGTNSNSEIELFALFPYKNGDKVENINLNLFTSLEYIRILEWMHKGKNYEKAFTLTREEMDRVFGVNKRSKITDLDIYDLEGTLKNENINLLLFSGAFLKYTESKSPLLKSKSIFYQRKDDNDLLHGLLDSFGQTGTNSGVALAQMSGYDMGSLLNGLVQNLHIDVVVNMGDDEETPPWIRRDITPPVITLAGVNSLVLIVGDTYTDAGATAYDHEDGNITANIIVHSDVDSTTIGRYTVSYDVNDSAGNSATTVSRTVNVVRSINTTLEDLNLTVRVRGDIREQDNGNGDTIHPIVVNPQHGTAEHYLLGNEIPHIHYTSTDCFVGLDSFIYRNENEYGRVNVTITAPASVVAERPNYSETLLNNAKIEGEYLVPNDPQIEITTAPTHGTATLENPTHEIVFYSYDPDDTYVGEDFFIYTITENINGCTYTSTGRVDFTVQASNRNPTLRLLGASIETILLNSTYHDAGATAYDNEDGNITGNIVITNEVNSSRLGTYHVTYDVNDSAGNSATTVSRTVNVVRSINTTLEDLNLTVRVRGDIREQDNGNGGTIYPIVINPEHGTAEHYLLGNEIPYIHYTSTDCFIGLDTFIYRNENEYGRVNVTITSPAQIETPNYSKTLENNTTVDAEELLYSTPHVEITTAPTHGTATLDNSNGEITYYSYDPVDTYVGADFFIYTVTENINGCVRTSTGRVDFTVQSSDTEKPIITLLGNTNEEIMLDSIYHDAGATAYDNEDGNITSNIVVTNEVNSSVVGTYLVSYNVADAQGNVATTRTRTVNVSSTANLKLLSLCQEPYSIGTELYKTDGTFTGTSLVKDIYVATREGTNIASPSNIYIPQNSKIGDIQYLTARDQRGMLLWFSNGTEEGTTNAENIGNSIYHIAIGNKLFFTAYDASVSSSVLYKTIGRVVTKISDHSGKKYSDIAGSLYYMSERNNTLFIEKSNSDFSGVEIVDSFNNYDATDVNNKMVTTNDTLFFTMQNKSDRGVGYELWSKKGNANAIKLSSTLLVNTYSSNMVVVGDKIYTIVNEKSSDGNRSILESDGTVEGTRVVYTFAEEDRASFLVEINNKLYMKIRKRTIAPNAEYHQIWEYDPKIKTAIMVKDLNLSKGVSTPPDVSNLYTLDGKIIFETSEIDTNGAFHRLWVSDGTNSGTIPFVKRYQHSGWGGLFQRVFKLNEFYFFQNFDNVLFKTDLTMEGTSVLIPNSCDIIPNPLNLIDLNGVELHQMQEAEVTIEGISYPETRVSIENGEYSLDNRQTWITTPSTVANGQQIFIRHMSSTSYNTTIDTLLHVGEISDTFSSTTKEEILVTPDTFTFTDRNAVALSTIQSDSITITGINQEVNLSIINGEYSLNNGRTWSDLNVTIENNQVVIVRHTSSGAYETAVSTTLTVGDISDVFTSTTRVEDIDSGDTIVIGNLMWEDTNHTRPNMDENNVNLNDVNYTQAVAYCEALNLEGYTDWRIPHAEWNSTIGYNRENNEFLSIRQQPLNLDGEVWVDVDNSSYTQLDLNSRSIVEPFIYMNQNSGPAYWTDDNEEQEGMHINVIFSGSLNNMDGWSDDWNSSVRCVRTLQTGNRPLVVDAGSDKTVEVNHAITIVGSATSSVTISSYEWKYGNDVIGTTASFEYTPTTVLNQIIVLKVIDADGNIAYDTMHLNVRGENPLPTVDAGENQSVQVDESITITGTASDNSAIAGQVWKEGETELADTLSFTYTPSSSGTKILTLIVTDDEGATASDTIEVEVTEAPDSTPNTFRFTDLTEVEPSAIQVATITITGINMESELSIINGSYSLDGGTNWSTEIANIHNNQEVQVRHWSSNEYTTTIETTLTVGGVSGIFRSTTREFVDQVPEVMIFGQTTTYNQTVYLGEDSPYVDAMISDDVGVTYCKWTDRVGTVLSEATVDPSEQNPYGVCELHLNPFTQVGEYIYTLTAIDTENQTNSNELNITVLPNNIPTADIGENRTISVGTTLNITATVNDADGDNMNYQWMFGIKDSGSMNGAGSTTEFSHQFNDEGLYTITFRVADNHNASVTKEIEVTVAK